MSYPKDVPFCLLAAGIGSRAGGKFHKTLMRGGKKAIISFLLDPIPIETEVVAILGYQEDIVKDYLLLAHPDRKFTFVSVPDYSIGPAVSLMAARSVLQRPFILCDCDSIIKSPIPSMECDWIAVSPTSTPEIYSTALVLGGQVLAFQDKAAVGLPFAFTGLRRIQSYEGFWSTLERHIASGDCGGVSVFADRSWFKELRAVYVNWEDIGTAEGYKQFIKSREENWILEKDLSELTYCVNARCIKLYLSKQQCANKIRRASILGDCVPPVLQAREYGFSTPWIPGRTLYSISDQKVWWRFFDWAEEKLAVPCEVPAFHTRSMDFYKCKTMDRIEEVKKKSLIDISKGWTINGQTVRPLTELLGLIDWQSLYHGIPCKWHGDLQPANVLVDHKGDFTLIDWRSDFGGAIEGGDFLYDLAKLWGGLALSYQKGLTDQGEVCISGGEIIYPEFADTLGIIRLLFEKWIDKRGYPVHTIRLLAALIHLNMSPLHVEPFSTRLLCTGWLELENLLKGKMNDDPY